MTEYRNLTCKLTGLSPLSFSRFHNEPWKTNASGSKAETNEEYDLRTWRSKLHTSGDNVYIPSSALKGAIEGAAAYNPTKKRGAATWTKNIIASVGVTEDILITNVTLPDVQCETLMMNSDGKPTRYSKGGRVPRTFPLIPKGWEAIATMLILDSTIPTNVIEQAIGDAGTFIGIGRWRPENRGNYGRFIASDFTWTVQ